MPDEPNPYAAPQCTEQSEPSPEETEAARVRRLYLPTEANIRSLGVFLLLAACMLLATLAAATINRPPRFSQRLDWLVLLIAAVELAVLLVIGWRLFRLDARARTPLLLVASAALIYFIAMARETQWFSLSPAAICILAISELLSRKGRFVLSPRYAQTIRETPEVQYRKSIALNVFGLGVCALVYTASLIPPITTHCPSRNRPAAVTPPPVVPANSAPSP